MENVPFLQVFPFDDIPVGTTMLKQGALPVFTSSDKTKVNARMPCFVLYPPKCTALTWHEDLTKVYQSLATKNPQVIDQYNGGDCPCGI